MHNSLMKKRAAIFSTLVLLLVFLSLAGCISGGDKNEEYLDDSTRIVTWGEGDNTEVKLEYIKDTNMYSLPFDPNYRPALDWLRANSDYSEKVMSWWDNGHMIQGYAKRQPLVFTPCREILNTVGGAWDANKLGELSDCNTLTNVAYSLLADSVTITQGIMKSQGAKWVFVTKLDPLKTGGMAQLLGDDVSKYLTEDGEVNGNVMHKTLYQMSAGANVVGFKLQYADDYASIYEYIPPEK